MKEEKMKKNILTTLIVFIIISLTMAACQLGVDSSDQPAETPETTGDSSMSSEVMFDPAAGGNADAAGLVYESLPVLALETTVSDDGLDYIISLRPGVTFHDGTSLNADAVIANFNRLFDPDESSVDGVEKVDNLTILIHLNEPDADFMNKLADPTFAIVSPDALAAPNFGSAAGVDGGSGPYMIGAWSATGLTLEPYAGYWNQNAVPDGSMDIILDN